MKKEDSDIDERWALNFSFFLLDKYNVVKNMLFYSVSKADLGTILQDKSFQSLAVPERSESRNLIQSFGKSVVTKTIRRGDGVSKSFLFMYYHIFVY